MHSVITRELEQHHPKHSNQLIQSDRIQGDQPEYNYFYWGGKFHTVPEGFEYPSKCNIRKLWDLWFTGNVEARISPYLNIKTIDLVSMKDKSYKSKAEFVIKYMLSTLDNVTSTMITRGNQQMKDDLFVKSYSSLCNFLYPDKSAEELDLLRIGERSYVTFYEKLKRNKTK
jgi:hypothetical protein